MKTKARFAVWALASAVFTSALLAQPPAEDCSAGSSLTDTDFFPQSLTLVPASDDFTLPEPSCNELGRDHVTCFNPTTSCSVDIVCRFTAGEPPPPAPGHDNIAVNLTSGMCQAMPASCVGSAGGGSGSSATLSSIGLIGGTNYCVVCESVDALPVEVEIIEVPASSCGALPIELLSWEID